MNELTPNKRILMKCILLIVNLIMVNSLFSILSGPDEMETYERIYGLYVVWSLVYYARLK